MLISLDKQQEKLVKELVVSGRYPDDAAVVRRGLDLLAMYERRMAELRAEILKGINSGEPLPLDLEAIRVKAREMHK